MKKISNKLIRDNIPDIIRANGGSCEISVLDDQNYRKELIRKMHEEIDEFDKDDNIEELADIFEVFSALIELKGYRFECVQREAQEKRQKNGGFSKRYYMTEYNDGR